VVQVKLLLSFADLGQQDWTLIARSDTFGLGRSILLELFMIFFSIFGAILLLNLLIAMMATTYQNVLESSRRQMHFEHVFSAVSADTSRFTFHVCFFVV